MATIRRSLAYNFEIFKGSLTFIPTSVKAQYSFVWHPGIFKNPVQFSTGPGKGGREANKERVRTFSFHFPKQASPARFAQ